MKVICFDLDGTLLDSRLRHRIVIQRAVSLFYDNTDDRMDFNDYVNYKSSGKNTLQYLLDVHKLSLEKAKIISEKWKEMIENPEYLNVDILYDDSILTLSMLEKEYDFILISARKEEKLLVQQLKNLNVYKYFMKIKCVSPYNARNEKQELLKIEKNVIMSVGDTEIDYAASKTNNILFYPLNRGFRNKSYWDSLNILSFKNLSNICKYLK
jgi:phosphoglycolate phosphatase-like HAD superfamily hydrolase